MAIIVRRYEEATGRRLVEDSLKQASRLNFRIMQFNAVVKENYRARKLYYYLLEGCKA